MPTDYKDVGLNTRLTLLLFFFSSHIYVLSYQQKRHSKIHFFTLEGTSQIVCGILYTEQNMAVSNTYYGYEYWL